MLIVHVHLDLLAEHFSFFGFAFFYDSFKKTLEYSNDGVPDGLYKMSFFLTLGFDFLNETIQKFNE
jgi:hypothetical protein